MKKIVLKRHVDLDAGTPGARRYYAGEQFVPDDVAGRLRGMEGVSFPDEKPTAPAVPPAPNAPAVVVDRKPADAGSTPSP